MKSPLVVLFFNNAKISVRIFFLYVITLRYFLISLGVESVTLIIVFRNIFLISKF